MMHTLVLDVSPPTDVYVNIKLKGQKNGKKNIHIFFCEDRKKVSCHSTSRAGGKCFCYEIVKVTSLREAELCGPTHEVSN
jgi:hypothetical protein